MSYPARLAVQLRCSEVGELDEMIIPIRSAAARAGVSCKIGRATLHIFERDGPYPSNPESGTVASILRALGADMTTASCHTWVLIGDEWFIVADDDDVLSDVEPVLGGSLRPVQPVWPVVSYPGAPGCTGTS